MNLTGLDKTQLEDLANGVRTKIHTITDNLHFGKELKDNEYQKSQMMLDILNQAIKEYGGSQMDPTARAAAQGMSAQKKLEKGQALTPDERKTVAKVLPKEEVQEGVEEQSELILAAKDMMDKVTGYLEDLASMKTEGMLELADRIRDEMGADKADAFIQKIQPALEQAESTLTQTRQDLDAGVRILTGEETATDTIGADTDTMNTDADLDDLESPEADEFGATDAEAGGTEPEGREQRESREVFETSNRIYAKLAGK
jgi:hypothetical protein